MCSMPMSTSTTSLRSQLLPLCLGLLLLAASLLRLLSALLLQLLLRCCLLASGLLLRGLHELIQLQHALLSVMRLAVLLASQGLVEQQQGTVVLERLLVRAQGQLCVAQHLEVSNQSQMRGAAE